MNQESARNEGEELRDEGLARAEGGHQDWIRQARRAAVLTAAQFGQVTAEDVRRLTPPPQGMHPSAMGAVFLTDLLEPAGYAKTTHKAGHARAIRIWRATEAGRSWAAAQRDGGQHRLFPGPRRETEGPPR